MASTDSRPLPLKNTALRITFPIYDADGDLVTGATGLDSEVSKDGGTFADCTNEATEIATASGMYYLDLTSTEMNADTVAVIVKTTSSGAKTSVFVMYPYEAGDTNTFSDDLLKRDMSAVTGESARSPLNALRAQRNKWAISGTTLTVYKEDDATSAWTSTLTATAGVNPITTSDPA
jgi:hypothetical protein